LTVMLWFLARDSVGESEATEIDPYEKEIHGKGSATLEEVFEFYDSQDFQVVATLARSIADKLEDYSPYWQGGGMGYEPLFITPAGVDKLRKDWPQIWKEFDLENPRPVRLNVTRPPAA
jgi:hypothetical protein